jgi:hypothetical protein
MRTLSSGTDPAGERLDESFAALGCRAHAA